MSSFFNEDTARSSFSPKPPVKPTEPIKDLVKLRQELDKALKEGLNEKSDVLDQPIYDVRGVLDVLKRFYRGGGGGAGGPAGSSVSIVDNMDGTYTLTINGVDTIINTVTPGDGVGDTVSFVDNANGTFTLTINGVPHNFDARDDQTVVLNSGAGINITGTYPNFTITNTAPGSPDQNLWATVAGNTGNATADTTTDTLTISGDGVDITTTVTGDTVAITAPGLRADLDTLLDAQDVDAIRVHATATQALTAGAATTIAYDTITHQAGSTSFNNGTDEVTVGVAGVYHLSSRLLFDAPTVGVLSNTVLSLQVDTGSGYLEVAQHRLPNSALGINQTFTMEADTDYFLPANSKVRVQVTYNSTLGGVLSALFPGAPSPVNSLSVHKVASTIRIGDEPTVVTIGSDQTTTSTVFVNLTPMVAALQANATYEVIAAVKFQTSATTVGGGFGFTSPTDSDSMLEIFIPQANAGSTAHVHVGSVGTSSASTASVNGPGANTNSVHYKGIIVTNGTPGNFQLTWRSETGGTITAYAGSKLILRRIA